MAIHPKANLPTPEDLKADLKADTLEDPLKDLLRAGMAAAAAVRPLEPRRMPRLTEILYKELFKTKGLRVSTLQVIRWSKGLSIELLSRLQL